MDANSNQLSSDGPSKYGISSNSAQHTADNASMDAPLSAVTTSYCTTSVTVPSDGHPAHPSTANVVHSTFSTAFHKDMTPVQTNSACLNSSENSSGEHPRPSGAVRAENPGPAHPHPPNYPPNPGLPSEQVAHSMSNHAEESSLSCPSADGASNKGVGVLFNFPQGSAGPIPSSYCANRQAFQTPYSTNSVLSNQSVPYDVGCQSNPMLPPAESHPVMTTPPKKMRNPSGAAAVARCSGLNSPTPNPNAAPTTPRSGVRRKRKGPPCDEQGTPQPKRPTHRGTKRIDEMFKVCSLTFVI